MKFRLRATVLPAAVILLTQVFASFISLYMLIGTCNNAGIGLDCSGGDGSLWPIVVILIIVLPPIFSLAISNIFGAELSTKQVLTIYLKVILLEIAAGLVFGILRSL